MPIHPMYQRALGALHFLTIIRWGNPGRFDPMGMVAYFPVVGLVMGALLALFDWGVSLLWPPPIVAAGAVVLLAVLSGALHIDGLADTADGVFSHRGRERALEIMKDSRVGVMGAVVVFLSLALKIAGIAGIDHQRGLMLLVIPALARGGIIAAMKWLPYGRPQGGTGKPFFNAKLSLRAFGGILPAILLATLGGWQGVLVVGCFAGLTGSLFLFFKRQLGCITGDMLGAMIEVTETGLFLAAAVNMP